MTDFETMSADERTALIQKIAPIIKESGLEGIEVKMSRECVCPMSADSLEDKCSLSIEKSFAPDKKDQVEAFKTKINEATSGVKNVKLDVKV